ncbi:hypothetical protein ACFXK0_19780 [Nocardia sp. NPDC059177]|uniref:hypothetical protein n=1 Tax=Nocardia sp. NPDC059177 TaxID=3346759 RepID=UPI003697B920
MQDLTDEDFRMHYNGDMWTLMDEFWQSWGQLVEPPMAPMYQSRIFPAELWQQMNFLHEPEPASIDHPSLRVVRREDGVLVSSCGLSWPARWSDAEPTNGFEVEVYAASSTVPSDADAAAVASGWLGRLVARIADLVSRDGFAFTRALERYSTLSIGIGEFDLPAELAETYLDESGYATVLLGMDIADVSRTITGPLSEIRLVHIKLLTPAETEFCVSGTTGVTDARTTLTQRFTTTGDALWTNPRPSVA